MRFFKYHALGNDYVVLDPADHPAWRAPSQAQVRVICHRNFGVGSDGILWGPLPSSKADFALRIFNPDGSEAEKSGNGLRIFSRYLWDRGRSTAPRLKIETPGGVVEASAGGAEGLITVDMGFVSFDSRRIPVAGPPREVISEELTAGGRTFRFCAATVGNPHCVIPVDDLSPELARRFGPEIETDPRFPNRTNVQFLRVIDRSAIQIEIWERGAGYTLASGSSASAAAAVANRLGLVDRSVAVRMPGGTLGIEIGDGFSVRMTGPVTKVAEGTLDAEMFKVTV
jgi:diaminopimelate epimerase